MIDFRFIVLTQGKFAIVDSENVEIINKHRWYALWKPNTKSFYAVRQAPRNNPNGKRYLIYLSRFILEINYGDKRQVDHLNHDTLDNRKENLEIKSIRGNSANRKDQSKYGVGIHLIKNSNRDKPFQLQIQVDGINKHIGVFQTAVQAQHARTEWLIKNGFES